MRVVACVDQKVSESVCMQFTLTLRSKITCELLAGTALSTDCEKCIVKTHTACIRSENNLSIA